jgi:hypothetical protein
MAISTSLKKISLATIGASVVALGVAGTAKAATLNNTTGLINPSQSITFNELPLAEGEQVTNQFSSLGVTFTNLYNTTLYNGEYHHVAGNSLVNFRESVNGPFSIKFNTNQSAAAFTLVTNHGISTLTALLNGVVVEKFNADTTTFPTDPGNFYGFTDINFDEILITPGGNNTAALIDNIQAVATPKSVPEPASVFSLLALGCIGAASTLKRKQQ